MAPDTNHFEYQEQNNDLSWNRNCLQQMQFHNSFLSPPLVTYEDSAARKNSKGEYHSVVFVGILEAITRRENVVVFPLQSHSTSSLEKL